MSKMTLKPTDNFYVQEHKTKLLLLSSRDLLKYLKIPIYLPISAVAEN